MELVKQTRAHVARLDLSTAQIAVLDGQAHTARALWNLLHEYVTFRQGRLASVKDCDAAIRQARREIDWIGQLPAQAAQAVLKTYRQAWANVFDPGHPAKRPSFKSRVRSRMAVDVPQGRDLNIVRLNRRWGAVNLPKAGRARFRWTKDLPGVTKGGPAGRITGARLVKEAGSWHIVFRTERQVPAPVSRPGPQVGIDRGINVALALSDGTTREHGDWLASGEKEHLRRLEKKAARQRRTRTPGQPTSKRLSRTYGQIARLRATAKRRAVNWQHQTTTELADTFSVVVVEDLKIANMVRVPYFLTLHRYDALRSGLAFLGPTLAITVGNLAAERLIPHLGTYRTLVLSLVVGAAGTAVLAASLSVSGSYLGLLAGVVGFGLGAGLSFATMFIVASTGVAPHEQGAVSGLSSTVLQAGAGAGLAILVVVAGHDTAGLTGEALRAATVDGLRSALFVAAAVAATGSVAVLAFIREHRKPALTGLTVVEE
ncbi:RNA-guided endonuclease TnpB family protein [Microtetraspora malaysiensis]|uniref:RNA-guided endonuclease TnpB family protein n=1 Tax=Microtetraspora malaysiensis TaxID=161358 RepID=A0ABW6SHW9_9ACTN